MPTYADIGKVPKDLLLGTPKSGAFTFDPRLSWTSTTSDGISFAVAATQKADRIDGSIKVSYAAQNYTADTLVDPSGAVLLNASVSPDSVKGLKVLASALVADPASAKLTLDYSPTREVNVKATTTLTSAPLVDLVGTVEYQGLLLGGEVAFDTAKSNVLRQNIALGYNTVDYQVGAFLTDKATVGKFSYAHSISPTTTVGAEVSRKLSTGDTTFTLGYANKLSNGALAKLKLDSTGLLSGLYETRLASGEKVAGSLQLQGTDLSKPLKYGFAVDLS